MIKFKIDIAEALDNVGFNYYKAKQSGMMSQDTLKKIRNKDTEIELKSLNALCLILKMDIGDIVTFEPTSQELEKRHKYIEN